MNLKEEILKIKNEMIDEFDKRVEALKEDEQEFPQLGDEYLYIDNDGVVMEMEWRGIEYDQGRLSIDNVFRTKEQAEFAVEKLKVEAEMRKFSRPFENGKFNYYLFFDIDGNSIITDFTSYCPPQGAIYFESEEIAREAIKSVGKERIKKYIFGVEDLIND